MGVDSVLTHFESSMYPLGACFVVVLACFRQNSTFRASLVQELRSIGWSAQIDPTKQMPTKNWSMWLLGTEDTIKARAKTRSNRKI